MRWWDLFYVGGTTEAYENSKTKVDGGKVLGSEKHNIVDAGQIGLGWWSCFSFPYRVMRV